MLENGNNEHPITPCINAEVSIYDMKLNRKTEIIFAIFVLLNLLFIPFVLAQISPEKALDYAIVYKQGGIGGIGKSLALGVIGSTAPGAAIIQGIQLTEAVSTIISAANPAALILSLGKNYIEGQITTAAFMGLAKTSPELARAYGIYERLDALGAKPSSSSQMMQTESKENTNVLVKLDSEGNLKKLDAALEKKSAVGDLIRGDLKSDEGIVENIDLSIDRETGKTSFKGRKGGGAVRISDEFSINLEEGEELVYTFNEKTGAGALELSRGSIKINDAVYKNLQKAAFKLDREKQIEFAEFDATAISVYSFNYNNDKISIEAKKDSHVKFDPKESKKIEGKDILLKYKEQYASGDFTMDVSAEGKIMKVTLLKKDSSYRFEKYDVIAAKDENVAIYFNGEQVSDKNGISFSKEDISIKGNVAMKEWLSDKRDKLKIYVQGKDGTIADISISGGKDSLSVEKGEIMFYSGIINMPENVMLSFKESNCFSVSDEGSVEWGSSDKEECVKTGQAKDFSEFQAAQEKIRERIKNDITGAAEEKEIVSQEDINLLEEIKKQQEGKSITYTEAIQRYNGLKRKYSGTIFENNIDLGIAEAYTAKGDEENAKKVYDGIYSREIKRLEQKVNENPADIDSKSRLANMYRATQKFDKAEKECNSVVSLADSIKSSPSATNEKKLEATGAKANALVILSAKYPEKIDDAISSYKEIAAQSQSKDDIESARLNTAILHTEKRKRLLASGNEKESLNEGLKAIGDLGAYAKMADDPEKKKFAEAMQNNIRVDLLISYQKRAIELNDEESARNAKLMYEQLGGDKEFKKNADEIISNYETGLQSAAAHGFVDEKSVTYSAFKKDLTEYKDFLGQIAGQGEYIGIVRDELENIHKKELDAKDAETKSAFDKLAAEYSGAKTHEEISSISAEIVSKREKVYKNDEVLQSLISQSEKLSNTISAIEQAPKEQRNYLKSLEGQKKGELAYINGLIGQRKEKLTGEKDADALLPEIFSLMNEKSELEKKQTKVFGVRVLPSFAQSLVQPALSGEISGIDDRLKQKKEEWDSRLPVTETKYNPFTGKDTTADREGIVLTPFVVPNDIAKSVAEIYASMQGMGLGATAVKALGSKTALAVVTEKGMAVAAPNIARKIAMDATAFHISNNVIKIGLGEDADWSPGAFADTAVTFSLLGGAGMATSKAVFSLPGTTVKVGEVLMPARAGQTALKIAQPVVETASLAGFQIAEEVARRNFDVSKDNLAFIAEEAFENNAAFIGAMKLAHYNPTAKEPAIKSVKIPEMENSIKQKMSALQEIRNNPENFENDMLKESAKNRMIELSKEVMSSQADWIAEYKKQNDLAYEVGTLNKKQHTLNKDYITTAEKEMNLNQKLFDMREEYYTKDTISSTAVINENPALIELKIELLNSKNQFLKEQSKQKIISSSDYKAESAKISEEINLLKETKINARKNENLPIAEEKEAGKSPGSLLTKIKKVVNMPLTPKEVYKEAEFDFENQKYSAAEAEFREIVEETPAESKEHHDARFMLANTLSEEGKTNPAKYEEAIAEYDNFIKEYPEGLVVGELPEYAELKKIDAEISLKRYPEAVSELKLFEEKAKVIPRETILKEENKAVDFFLRETTPAFIETNFRALNIPEAEIEAAKSNPLERIHILENHVSDPALVMGGLPQTEKNAPAEAPAIAPEVIEKSEISKKVIMELRDFIIKNAKDVIPAEYLDDSILSQLISARRSHTEEEFTDAKRGITEILKSKGMDLKQASEKANLAVEKLRERTAISPTSKKIAQLKGEIKEKIKDIITLDDDAMDFLAKASLGGESVIEASYFELTMKIEKQSGLSRLKSYDKAGDIINRMLNRKEVVFEGAGSLEDVKSQFKEDIKEKTSEVIALDDDTLDFLAEASIGGDAVLRASDFELSAIIEEQGLTKQESNDMANYILGLLLKRKKVDTVGIETVEDIQSQTGLKIFYTVEGIKDTVRLLTGEGDWPTAPTRAHMGPGVYAWNNLDTAKQYLEARKEELKTRDLGIVAVVFYEDTLKDLNTLDLTKMSDDEANAWLDEHSLLDNQNAAPADYEYVIRGVSEKYGEEHYFPVNIFKDYAGAIVVE